jgi:DNA-binding transcriptional ArsR family regulator
VRMVVSGTCCHSRLARKGSQRWLSKRISDSGALTIPMFAGSFLLTTHSFSLILNLMVQYSTAGRIDGALSAVSDPTRRKILERLSHGPERISDVAQRFPMTLTGFCKHVRVLERAGLVRRMKCGRENILELQAEPLRDVASWVLSYERYWNSRLDRLHSFFAQKKERSE